VRVLVTGGAGFIGSHVVEMLVAADHDVRVLDVHHPRAHAAPPPRHPDVEYLHGDVADRATASRAVAGVDGVCHQAAMVGLGVDFGDVESYVHDNDLGTAALLGALHRSGWAGSLVVASSMVVYGEGRSRCGTHGVVRPGPRAPAALDRGEYEPTCPRCGETLTPEAVGEDAPTDPRNVYAATKLHTEHLAFAFGREHPACRVVALRYHNVYGPRMPRDTPYAGVASIFRSALERGEAPRVFEDGRQTRDFVHVRDIARANLLALAHPHATGAFNVASGVPRTVGDLAGALCAAFGADPPTIAGGYRVGDVRHVFASTERARAELGFTAEIDFDTGVREFANAPLR
jgi:dTDP-L-rhamnose 4-epimerase